MQLSDFDIYLNGIDIRSGEYLAAPFRISEAAKYIRESPVAAEVSRPATSLLKSFGLADPRTADDLALSGWAILFPKGTSAAIRDALQPLIEHRRKVANSRCQVFEDWEGQSCDEWLREHSAHGSEVDPVNVPYYVLLVGGPDRIPFRFQYELDVDYAVGRLAFDDEKHYADYAMAVIDYETSGDPPTNARELVYWGTRHGGDRATELSADYLISVLHGEKWPDGKPTGESPVAAAARFRSRCLLGDDREFPATKKSLCSILQAESGRPALLFTASHGMGGWPSGSSEQRAKQGALLCQDWSGFGKLKPDHYLTAAEIGQSARHDGMIAFVFACYSAGTPQFDDFLKKRPDKPKDTHEIAATPFVSALGQRLLAGGALAVIGHIDRAWESSILPPGSPPVAPQLQSFRNLLRRLMSGERVAHSMRDFSERYASASVRLLNKLGSGSPAAFVKTDESLVRDWIERNDAQNYVVLGDPAVALRADELK